MVLPIHEHIVYQGLQTTFSEEPLFIQKHAFKDLPNIHCNCMHTGNFTTLNDGTQQYKGVRVLKLRADPKKTAPTGRTVVSGGSDGCVMQWDLLQVDGVRKVRVMM